MALTEQGNLTSLADAGYTRDDIVNFFQSLSSQFDVSVESDDIGKLEAKLLGESGCIRAIGGNPQRCFDQFTEQYRRRGRPDVTPGIEGSGHVDSATLSAPSLTVERPVSRPEVGGRQYEAFQTPEGQTAFRFYTPPPPPVASMVVGDMGVTADALPTVGPVGLAQPRAPINYATGQAGPEFGYGFGGTPEPFATAGAAPRSGSNMTMFVLLAAAAVAAIVLFGKKK